MQFTGAEVTTVPWAYVCESICLLGTLVIPAKTDEPIEMLFGGKLVLAQTDVHIGATRQI